MCGHFWLKIAVLSGFLSVVELCQVYLTISPNGDSYEKSFLEINWGPDCKTVPQTIGIYEDNPSIWEYPPKLSIQTNNRSSGYFLTDIPLGKLELPEDIFTTTNSGTCVNYYIAGYTDGTLIVLNCFKVRPRWMTLEKYVDIVPLKDLFIPGTHASGCYLHSSSPLYSTLLRDFIFTQNFDVYTQLLLGVRYLDLTISFSAYESDNGNDLKNYYISNLNNLVNPLSKVLSDIKKFIALSNEVVIVDLSSFAKGIYNRPERYSEIIMILEKEFGSLILRQDNANDSENCYKLSVQDIRSGGFNIVILLPREVLRFIKKDKLNLFCPTWKKFSPAHLNESETLDFMRYLFSGKNTSLTMNEGWIFFRTKHLELLGWSKPFPTTAERAGEMNKNMSKWLGGAWSLNANVVAADFIASTALIDSAIYANRHKGLEFSRLNLTQLDII